MQWVMPKHVLIDDGATDKMTASEEAEQGWYGVMFPDF